MIYVGIDVAKDKHDCFITNSDGEVLFNVFTIANNLDGFNDLCQKIASVMEDVTKVKVGLEATGHYSYNLLGYLIDKGLPTYVINPLHTNLYRKSLSLRQTKTDKVDARTIASMLMSDVNLKSYSDTSYHNEELKSLTRYRLFVSSNHWHFFQVPCFMGKSLLAWAFALHKHAAVWAPIIQAPHTGALITHAL